MVPTNHLVPPSDPDSVDRDPLPFDNSLLRRVEDIGFDERQAIAREIVREMKGDIIQYWPLLAVKYLHIPVPLGNHRLTLEHRHYIHMVLRALLLAVGRTDSAHRAELLRIVRDSCNDTFENVIDFIAFVEHQRTSL